MPVSKLCCLGSYCFSDGRKLQPRRPSSRLARQKPSSSWTATTTTMTANCRHSSHTYVAYQPGRL